MDINFLNRPAFIFGLFILILGICLAPVLCFKYFPTVDGPAHLYNAKIIREFWFGNSEFYKPYFSFNAEPVPNWTGHIIAIIAGLFLPVWMVEKILILLIVAGIPFSMWHLSGSYAAKTNWKIFLLLPFVYPVTLYLGFFNFMLSLVLLLLLISMLARWNERLNNKYFLLVIFLATLLYFTHVLAFGVAIMVAGLQIVIEQINKETIRLQKPDLLKIFVFVPGILLAVKFFSSRNMEGFRNKTEQLSMENLLKCLGEGSVLSGLNGVVEVPYTTIFVRGILLLLIVALIFRIIRKTGWKQEDLMLVLSMIFLICFFLLPDGMASGGFISLRMILLSLMFAVIWLITVKMPVWICLIAALLGIYTSFSTLSYRLEVASNLNADVKNYLEASTEIPEQSVVLPLNYSNNWLHINISNYAGAAKDILILDNYEAVLKEFPLTWNDKTAPQAKLGNFTQSLNPFITIDAYEKISGQKIDCVMRWAYPKGTTDSISLSTNNILVKEFKTYSHNGAGETFCNRLGQ